MQSNLIIYPLTISVSWQWMQVSFSTTGRLPHFLHIAEPHPLHALLKNLTALPHFGHSNSSSRMEIVSSPSTFFVSDSPQVLHFLAFIGFIVSQKLQLTTAAKSCIASGSMPRSKHSISFTNSSAL